MSYFKNLLCAALALAAPAASAATVDQMIIIGGGLMSAAPLPAGPVGPLLAPIDSRVQSIFALPDGRLLAVALLPTGNPSPFSFVSTLNVLEADGSLRQLATFPGNYLVSSAAVVDMDLDSHGHFYVLTSLPSVEVPNQTDFSLIEVDTETGAFRSHRRVPDFRSIATSPGGLWVLYEGWLRELDTSSLDLGPRVVELGSAGNLEADSTGRLYLNRVCSPPCRRLGTFDPAFGGAVEEAPAALYEGVPGVTRFTIRRRCYGSDEAICLQGGRFRAAVSFTDFAGESGAAKVASDRSRDTGIFWFFEPANWELMAKVLDGCNLNGHFWLYSSASTDVAYTLTLTDTATGAQRSYANPLGQTALTVTDGAAFACP